ncbi:hypothetical protein [Candidatus Protochlamydia phocaeensis]|uniref:hypothetical protein n=1 Tax=Candidatus Protochlamydia phocaeensis TaxID=1414722 RepID=UPI000838D046|nr:hypothetical protein [Candidatus Protochlamydia phocaeensis]
MNISLYSQNWASKVFDKIKVTTQTSADITSEWAGKVGKWTGRAVVYIKSIPSRMQESDRYAVAVILGANLAMFALIYKITAFVNRRIQADSPPLDNDQIRIKNYVLDFITGTSMLTFNLVFSRLTQYSIHPLAIAAFAISSIILRRGLARESTSTASV